MDLLVSILIGAGCIGIGVFFALGVTSMHSSEWLNRAIEFTRRKEYEAARRAVLRAVRLKPSLRNNEDLRALYETIVSDDFTRVPTVLRQLEANIDNWPKTKLEGFFHSLTFRILLITFIVIVVIIKIANF